MSGAALLRRLRSAAGVSQEALAERSGLSERTIRALESGAAKRPHRDTLLAVAAALTLAPPETETWVTAWRPTRRALTDVFHSDAPSGALRDEWEQQRRRTRDLLVRIAVEVKANRNWASLRIERVIEVLEDGVDTFCWMQGYPAGLDADRLWPVDCVNVEPITSAELPSGPAKIFYGSLRHTLRVGQTYSLAYGFDYDAAMPADGSIVTDNEMLFSAMAPTRGMMVEVRFDPAGLPARVRQVRQSTVNGPPEPGDEVHVSPFGVVASHELPAGVGVYGLRWEWT